MARRVAITNVQNPQEVLQPHLMANVIFTI